MLTVKKAHKLKENEVQRKYGDFEWMTVGKYITPNFLGHCYVYFVYLDKYRRKTLGKLLV